MSTISSPPRGRTLERRLFGWILALTLVPALVLLAAGGWAVSRSLEVAGAVGPWEEVAASGRRVVELAEPGADPALQDALATHRDDLSASLTQARRWAFLGERLQSMLPWATLAMALVLAALAALASRRLARGLARPIRQLVVVAERMGADEPLPPPGRATVREVAVLDRALREAASSLAAARERALATERMRAWGEMARRVAHEMKNPLTPLRLAAHRYRQASATSPAASPALAEAAEVIDQEVARLEELARRFSELGRPPEGPATTVDIPQLLESLLETDAGPGVETRLDAAAGLPPVTGHYDTLFRAFRNLVRNALDATEGRSSRWIEATVAAVEEGRWLEVRIADNGVGLPPGDVARIFEPDFTTRHHGSGLGLALVRQAVESDGGTVTARDRRGGGAEFVIRLPVDGAGETVERFQGGSG